ncbi:MAG: cysteine--tRNA ligase [Syntrophothermaceae bacterium]|jgi:cysteinyl-tRNA synthetase
MIRVYNTLTKSKEVLNTLEPQKVKMYVCGPTTYNYIHLGNARPLVVFDIIRRYLKYRGYQVTYVQNFTDVDDKIIARSQEEGVNAAELAEKYIGEFFRDADALGVMRADTHPRVSDHMPDIIKVIEGLIEKGYAYEVEGDIYYRVNAFDKYGCLSGRSLDEMRAGARVEVDERKESPMDFALWKQAKPGEPSWDSPWGQGRPGWHIECSVMAMKYLGDTVDIHGGGADLVFPHHENEIAQSEAYTGEPFANYWIHNGFITINKEKMSKSLGNFFLLRDILDRYPADVVRFYLGTTHYRSPLDFDDGKLEEAARALGRLKNVLRRMDESVSVQAGTEETDEKGQELLAVLKRLEHEFMAAMDDDFNTARAVGYLFDMAREINTFIDAQGDESLSGAASGVLRQARQVFVRLGNDILGLLSGGEVVREDIVDKLLSILVGYRSQARRERDFAVADSIRDFLTSIGVSLEDTPGGTRINYGETLEMGDLVDFMLDWRTQARKSKDFVRADQIRDQLQEVGVIIEDTREGARWRIDEAGKL